MAAAHAQSLGKRGMESSTPTEQWTRLARTVPATLLVATSESEKVIRRIESTQQELLGVSVADLLMGRQALLRHPPQDSCSDVARLVALHAAAGRVFSQCAAPARLAGPLQGDVDASWRTWEGRRAEAARHGDEAAWRMRAAMSDLAAALLVLLVVQRRPPESPPRVAWSSEAERLLRRAAGEVAAARGAVLRMRDAVALEFFDAWAVLTSCEARTN